MNNTFMQLISLAKTHTKDVVWYLVIFLVLAGLLFIPPQQEYQNFELVLPMGKRIQMKCLADSPSRFSTLFHKPKNECTLVLHGEKIV